MQCAILTGEDKPSPGAAAGTTTQACNKSWEGYPGHDVNRVSFQAPDEGPGDLPAPRSGPRMGFRSGDEADSRLPQRDCCVNVLRDGRAVDSLQPCGVYFGTTGGQVYASADAGDSWAPIVRDLPAVLSVEVQTLP